MAVRKIPRVDTDLLELGDRRIHHPQRVAVSSKGMIATAHWRATEAGAEILAEGGNAVDAAVAAAFALGVCEPAASGIGGQTMILLHHAESGRTIALDGSSRAPHRATVEVLPKERRRRGHASTTVPSTPATLRYALERYGRLKLARVLEPAIRLAEEGYEVSPLQYALTRRELKNLKASSAGPFFLRDGRRQYRIGSTLKQPVLAATLRRLAKHGVKDFYSGRIAKQIHEDMTRNDGLLRLDDLAQVPRPIERRPLSCRFNGLRVFTFPPPAAGRTLVQMMQVWQQLPERYRDIDRPRGAVALAEIVRRAFLDRQDRPFDPNYFPQVERRKTLSDDYARLVAKQVVKRVNALDEKKPHVTDVPAAKRKDKRRKSKKAVDPSAAAVTSQDGPPHGETTHLSAMDAHGNVVALTQSIERVYGSFAVTPELGFLYNNYMMAFEYEDIAHPYYLRPNAVPWASVAPTIVMRGRRPWVAIGSPGSERIAPAILQVLVRLQDHTPLAAVDAPRLFCSLTGTVALEATRMRDDIPRALERRGFELNVRDPHSFYLGCVQVVVRERDRFIGVADPRRDGSARGPR